MPFIRLNIIRALAQRPPAHIAPHAAHTLPTSSAPTIAPDAAWRIRNATDRAIARLAPNAAREQAFSAAQVLGVSAAKRAELGPILAESMAWVDDGRCYARAWFSGEIINGAMRGVTGRHDAHFAAAAFVNDPKGHWRYHVAPAVRDADTGAWMVFDKTGHPGKEWITHAEFAKSLGKGVQDVRLVDPSARPLAPGRYGAAELMDGANRLMETVRVEQGRISAFTAYLDRRNAG